MHYALLLGIFFLSYLFTRVLLHVFKRSFLRQHALDHPKERSNHTTPIPRGGGLAVVLVMTCGALIVHYFFPTTLFSFNDLLLILLLFNILGLVGLVDDFVELSFFLKLMVQFIVVIAAQSLFFPNEFLFQGHLPLALDRSLMVVGWVWFINLYNFMDGIDEMTAAHTTFITLVLCLSLYTLLALHYPHIDLSMHKVFLYDAILVVASILAFWRVNQHPARIFLGDVGSLAFGFIVGFLLIKLASKGYLLLALLPVGYYGADTTLTLLRRIIAGKPFWRAHSEHFYQKAVRSGIEHTRVVTYVLLCHLALFLLGMGTLASPVMTYVAIFVGMCFIGYLLWFFECRYQDRKK